MHSFSSIRLSATGLVVEGNAFPQSILAFIDSVLRGIGQVMLQNNSFTGVLFLMGMFWSAPLVGVATVVGTVASTLTAIVLGVSTSQVRDGLFGFNGALAALAVLHFLSPDSLAWGYAVLAAACTTVVMAAFLRLCATWELPALTAPFVLVTLCFVLAAAGFDHLHLLSEHAPAASIATATESHTLLSTLVTGLLAGVAQVFLQDNCITGVFLLAGLLVSSCRAALVALVASLFGLLIAYGLGATEADMRAGIFGFNAVLTAIVLGGMALNAASILYGALAVLTTTVMFVALSSVLGALTIPTLTAPFVITTWLFVLARPLFSRL